MWDQPGDSTVGLFNVPCVGGVVWLSLHVSVPVVGRSLLE